jgi:hypothetical protein
MAASIGPNTTENGLILNLDAANIKSFRGEPTTNLALDCPVAESTIKLMTSESNYRPINSNAHGSVVQVYDVEPPVEDMAVWKMYNSNPDNYSRFGIGQSGSSKIRIDDFGDYNVTYIASIYVYLPYGVTYGTANNCWAYQNSTGTDWHGGTYIDTPHPDYGYYGSSITDTYTSADKDITNEWQRLSVTFTTSSTIKDYGGENNCPYITIQFRPSLVGTDGNSFLYISSLQIEEMSYITPFICGTRGSTVATGGGLIDLSGNENDGELVNGPIFDSSNLGSLEFDGIDDYIDCGNDSSIQLTTVGTIDMFFKPTSSFSGNTGTQKHLLSGGPSYFYFSSSSSKLHYFLADGSTGIGSNSGSWDSTWYNVVITCDSVTLKMFINGIQQDATTGTNSSNFFINNGSLRICIGSGYFPGKIANTQIYNRALNQAEVTQNFEALKGRFGL